MNSVIYYTSQSHPVSQSVCLCLSVITVEGIMLTFSLYIYFFFLKSFVEAVYLNNEEALNLQTREDHHIFQWLKHQAQRGAADAEVPIVSSSDYFYFLKLSRYTFCNCLKTF